MNALANWERESFVRMQFVHEPCRHTIAAELLRDEVLMEVDKGVDAVLARLIDELLHLIQIGLVVFIWGGFHACPHHP